MEGRGQVPLGDNYNVYYDDTNTATVPSLATLPANVLVPGGGVRVSSCAGGGVGGGQGAGPSLHTPPYTHFIKQVPATNNTHYFLCS